MMVIEQKDKDTEQKPAKQQGHPGVTETHAAEDTSTHPTFTGQPTLPVPDLEPNTRPPIWLQNVLVSDQNKEDFVWIQENVGGYNGLRWHAICLKCGWQTYQFKKEDAVSYLLNYHLIVHIKQGDQPITPALIGPTSETMAPSGIPYGPQYGQVAAGQPEHKAGRPPRPINESQSPKK
jgi:hypothetical protein